MGSVHLFLTDDSEDDYYYLHDPCIESRPVGKIPTPWDSAVGLLDDSGRSWSAGNAMLTAKQLYEMRNTKYEIRAFMAIATCLAAGGLLCLTGVL